MADCNIQLNIHMTQIPLVSSKLNESSATPSNVNRILSVQYRQMFTVSEETRNEPDNECCC